jgi:hypothetical protein
MQMGADSPAILIFGFVVFSARTSKPVPIKSDLQKAVWIPG